jgi:hypothetical protein
MDNWSFEVVERVSCQWTEVLYSDSGDCIFLCNDMYQAIFSDRASRLSSAPGY